MKEWLFLIGAIVLETFATSMLKYSEQFTRLLPTIAMAVGYLLSFVAITFTPCLRASSIKIGFTCF